MKKIFMAASLAAGLTLITSCSVKLTENEKSWGGGGGGGGGGETHNFIVINNKLDKVLENQEQIIKQNKEMLEILRKQ